MEVLPTHNSQEEERELSDIELIDQISTPTREEISLATGKMVGIESLVNEFSHKHEVFLVKLGDGNRAIFKPRSGEEPDLRERIAAGTYANRSRATHIVDKFMQLAVTPTTVMRDVDGYGEGSLQRFIPNLKMGIEMKIDENRLFTNGYIRLAILDYINFNTDRNWRNYGVASGELYGIDNDLTFNGAPNELDIACAGMIHREPVPEDILQKISDLTRRPRVVEAMKQSLFKLLPEEEVDAASQRLFYLNKELKKNGGIVPDFHELPSFL